MTLLFSFRYTLTYLIFNWRYTITPQLYKWPHLQNGTSRTHSQGIESLLDHYQHWRQPSLKARGVQIESLPVDPPAKNDPFSAVVTALATRLRIAMPG